MDTTTSPTPSLPPQALPVVRDPWRQPRQGPDQGAEGAEGVQAARSGCADLWGPARQMCYAQRSYAL
ncbi:hypothetical protein HHL19_15030 [Streptomyces sp. R302]|uniref:hypothetical protein n=1 Tax=unclassified Streptomyces TaxID=2593676 RepID=UPI00145F432A|nr:MULTISPECIES: hypothetical protein [unclassified Streptomyces]NML51385.1 hypothetical protein [Streptomyces sp. R301]NML79963.1 hypothetical protein [Streptomyces sp. R302]